MERKLGFHVMKATNWREHKLAHARILESGHQSPLFVKVSTTSFPDLNYEDIISTRNPSFKEGLTTKDVT